MGIKITNVNLPSLRSARDTQTTAKLNPRYAIILAVIKSAVLMSGN